LPNDTWVTEVEHISLQTTTFFIFMFVSVPHSSPSSVWSVISFGCSSIMWTFVFSTDSHNTHNHHSMTIRFLTCWLAACKWMTVSDGQARTDWLHVTCGQFSCGGKYSNAAYEVY
jgi:hypothetical protein